MATKKRAKNNSWMDDGDDAHFSGNPAYREPGRKKGKKRVVKSYSHSQSFNRIYGKPQAAPKKASKKRVFVKQ